MALIELLGGFALLGLIFGIFVSTLQHLKSIDGRALAANRATIAIHNTLERIESERDVSAERAEQILAEEFAHCELAHWGNFVSTATVKDGVVNLLILDLQDRVVASAGMNE